MEKVSNMNILVGRLGFTVKFTGFKIGTQTSCDTDMMVYSLLSQLNPEYNFYFIGPNDLEKLSEDEYNEIFPNHNVYSAWNRVLAKEKDVKICLFIFIPLIYTQLPFRPNNFHGFHPQRLILLF